MDAKGSFYTRLQSWREDIGRKARQHWWYWPVGFALDLFWHRIYSCINGLLDRNGVAVIAPILSRIPSDPVVLALITAVLIVAGLTIHAYFDTRPKVSTSLVRPQQPGAVVSTYPGAPDLLAGLAPIAPQSEDDAPELVVSYGKDRELVLSLETPTSPAAYSPMLGTLLSYDRHSHEYPLTVEPQAIGTVLYGKDVKVRLCGASDCSSGLASLSPIEDLLRYGDSTTDVVVIDYEDKHGHQFSRPFDLRRNTDGTVTWKPGIISKRGNVELPDPEIQDLAMLRQKLCLASNYPHEHNASVQCSEQLIEVRCELSKANARISELESELDTPPIMVGNVSVRIDDTPDPKHSMLVYQCTCMNYGGQPCELVRISFGISNWKCSFDREQELAGDGLTIQRRGSFVRNGELMVTNVTPAELREAIHAVYLIDRLSKKHEMCVGIS